MAKKKFGTERKIQADLDGKQSMIEFTDQVINADDMGLGDFRFTSLSKFQIDANNPLQDEGRLYVRDRDGVLYYLTATKVG